MNRARKAALLSLIKSTKCGAFSNLELDSTLRSATLSPEDRALYSQLYLGVIEKKITLDYLLSRISSSPLHTMEAEVLCILELGAYQILYLDRIPDRAAIFEAGELAKRYAPAALSLINAVLRRISGEKETVFSYLDLPGKKGLALRYGYPRYLVSLWQEAYGKDTCLAIMEAQNKRAPLTLRINTLKSTLSRVSAALTELGIGHHQNPLCKNALTLEESVTPSKLPGFEEGLFFVQDAAAARAVDLLEAKPGHRVLDLCAAPGGKSFGAAIDMEDKGEVLSLELHPNRLPLIAEGAVRLGISSIQTASGDSSLPAPQRIASFDRVICDVPCSGYGVIAKKPDIRHKAREEGESLPSLQLAILEQGAAALKPGGLLVYSTCTLNPKENEEVTEAFLSRNPDFRRCGEAETIFPVGGENDGFFCDRLEKLL
ncbi:MAG: 16S rRNA (cytosine(967)-C(5))-methyltransferase RsmB [Clostridia bacterium]|nr:16S rRNA (cytosine(967)-C(5))-methyltransferase RsmB [Clostridia bacterium]